MPVLESRKVWALLSSGVAEVAKVVRLTYGPRGGKVAVAKSGTVLVTTDGAAITREAQLGGYLRLGAKLVRSAALDTEKAVGDGTSTTVLLTDALLKEVGKLAAAPDWNPVQIVKEIREAEVEAEALLRDFASEATESILRRVAEMASHEDPEIASKVIEAVLAVGEQGSVTIAAYEGTGIVFEQREGLELPQGWASHAMCRSGIERELEGPLVAVFRQPLRRSEEIASAMETATQWPGRGLVVFAPGISGEALSTILVNDKGGTLPCVGVEYTGSPADRNDWLDDLAAVTNATVVDELAGFDRKNFEGPWLGYARRVTLRRNRTLVVSYLDEDILKKIDARASALKARAEASPYPFERDRLTERASALDGGLATLRVGGFTAPEAQDRRSRVEDALLAVQTALRGGVVPGGGRSYMVASRLLPETEGGRLLGRAMRTIVGTLAEREGLEPAVAIDRALETAEDDLPAYLHALPEVVDPHNVAVTALRNATSVACEIVLCGAVTKR